MMIETLGPTGTMPLIAALVFAVAVLYASVGHGGASGYLAILSLFAFAPDEMATTALTLNVLVSATAFFSFRAAGHFRSGLFVPLALASVPAAFLGGMAQVSAGVYAWLLGAALLVAAIWLIGQPTVQRDPAALRAGPPFFVLLCSGSGIGLISGLVGVGGGIFLSPLLLLLRWADPKETAAVAAGFVWVNSVSGLLGRAAGGNLVYGGLTWFVPVAFLGGLLGAHLGARHARGTTLRRLLAGVLLLAAVKLMMMGL